MSKRKEAPRSTQQQIEALEKIYDQCEKEMAEITETVKKLQESWNGTYEQLQILYKLKNESKGAKRTRMSITGKICPVIRRKESFPNPPKSM